MSISADGANGRTVSEINVTPLIDVLLVLLIIFMVIVPMAPKGLDTLIPQAPKSVNAESSPATIVVEVLPNGAGEPIYRINQTAFPKSAVEAQLAAIFRTRQDKVMFVWADPVLEFGKVAEVVDMAHRADVASVGLMTRRDFQAR